VSEERREVGVLDTSAVINLERLSSGHLPLKPLITTVTLAELSVGPLAARSEVAAVERQAHLQLAEADFEPLPFDALAAVPSDGCRLRCGGPPARRGRAPSTR
jgi:hypothetical protein